jgi:hypothetical protein
MLEIFRIPPDLSESLIAFCSRQDCYNLQELNALKADLSQYVGVYILYYRGDFSIYKLIKQANLNSCCMPIYVGKAAPSGRRTGRTTIGSTLYGRLSEHKKSIQAVDNLSVEDFQFQVAAMDIDLVSWGEAVLIATSIRFGIGKYRDSGFMTPAVDVLDRNVLYGINCTQVVLLQPSFL